MENSIASSYKAGLYRLIGTIVGAFVGVIFIFIQPGNALLMGVGTLVLIFICNTFNWDRAVPIAGVMFSAIMLSLNNKNPLLYSFSRVIDTFIGIVIAVSVNYIIFPPNNLAQMRKSLDIISEKISKPILEFICLEKNLDLCSLRSEVIDLIKFFENYKTEFKHKINRNSEFSNICGELESLRSILSHLKTIVELRPHCSLSPDNVNKLRILNPFEIKTYEFIESNENIIYNYHVGKVLDLIPKLNSSS